MSLWPNMVLRGSGLLGVKLVLKMMVFILCFWLLVVCTVFGRILVISLVIILTLVWVSVG